LITRALGGVEDGSGVGSTAALVLFARAAGTGGVASGVGARSGISFRKLLIELEIVEFSDLVIVAGIDILDDLEALEAFHFAQIGAGWPRGSTPSTDSLSSFSSFWHRCMFQAAVTRRWKVRAWR